MIYVDDDTAAAIGQEDVVITVLRAAANSLSEIVECELEIGLSADKLTTVASTPGLAQIGKAACCT